MPIASNKLNDQKLLTSRIPVTLPSSDTFIANKILVMYPKRLM